MSLGKSVFATVGNIRRIFGYRFGDISSFLHAEMTREEFSYIVDYICNIVYRLDNETAFSDTAKAWKELILKTQSKR